MIQIDPHLLWLGNARDCENVNAILEANIQSVLQLAVEEPQPKLPREIFFFRIPIHDGLDNQQVHLRMAVATVVQLLQLRIPVLVCCSAGASRSPAIAASGIAIAEGMSPTDALNLVHQRRRTDVSPGLWRDLVSLCNSW